MVTMRRAPLLLVAAIALAAAAPAAGAGPAAFGAGTILRAMARLDHAFVPALLATTHDEGGPATAAVARLERSWTRFAARWRGAGAGDPRWDGDLDAVGHDIADAQRFLRAARPRAAAASLEAARERLAGLRHRHHLDYFLDALAACRGPVDAIARLGEELEARNVEQSDLSLLTGRLLPAARSGLRRAREATLDNAVFRLSPQRLDQVAPLLEEEGRELDRLQAALDKGDTSELGVLAQAPREPCDRLYSLFGAGETSGP